MPTIILDLPNDGDDAIVEPYNTALQTIQALLNGGLDEDNFADGGIILAKLATAVADALVPSGAILPYGGATAPSAGWLLCNGAAISRSTYATLFAIIGTAFGVGNGTTTFNLPDFRGRVPVGIDNLGGTAANIIQRSTTITTTNGSPTATVASATGLVVGQYVVSTNVPAGTTVSAIVGTTLTLSANATASAGGVAARFSQFANDAQVIGAVGGVSSHVLITAQLAAHSHTTTNATADNTAGSTYVRVSDVLNARTFATGNAGGDQAHPNMQPSVATNYIIKA